MALTSEQIKARRKTIGGSDIGAILGENNYKTAYEVWEEKVEGKTVDLSRNKSVVIGNLLENALIEKYEMENRRICIRPDTVFHKKYKFLSANLDGSSSTNGDDWFPGNSPLWKEEKALEIKTTSSFNKDEWGASGSQIIPKHYYAQIAHYMLVTGYKSADVFVGFVDDSIVGDILCALNSSYENQTPNDVCIDFSEVVNKMETRLYTFHRDEEMEQLILEAAISFYNNHMEPWIERGEKIPPPMDFSNKKFQECLRKKYDIIEQSEIRLPIEFVEVKNKYLSATAQSKMFDKVAQEEKARIVEAMGNNQKATLNDGSYFLRNVVKVNRKACEAKESEYIKFEFKQSKE